MLPTALLAVVTQFVASVAAAPREPSISIRAQAAVESALEPRRADAGPGCVCAAISAGEFLALGMAGYASVEHQALLTQTTPLYVGSISKQFIAAIALTLDDLDELDLDAPVTALIPELRSHYEAVIGRKLLTHTSGIRDYLQLAHHAGAGLWESRTTDETLELIARQSRLDFPPGTDASYSNSNYFLLSMMIERATGETIGEVATRLIFKPLGMQSSRLLIDGLEVVPGRARGYRRTREGEYRLHEPAPGVGGMLTTLDDLLLWTRHLQRMQEEKDPLLATMTAPAVLRDGRTTNEAAGLRVVTRFDRRVIEHNGSNRGFNAHLSWYPDDDVFVVVMCNVRQARATSRAHEIAAGLFDEEPVSRVSYPKLDSEDIERLSIYAGFYRSLGGNGALELEVDEPHAILTVYGDHPSDPRTASNLLEPTDNADVFALFGLSPGGRLMLGTDARPPTVALELQSGATRRYRKVTPPGEAALLRVAGRFWSAELNVIYDLSLMDGLLLLTIERPNGQTVDRGRLIPITRNFCALESDLVSNIRLTRDARDHVIGFELNEPRLRGLAFRRLPDDQ